MCVCVCVCVWCVFLWSPGSKMLFVLFQSDTRQSLPRPWNCTITKNTKHIQIIQCNFQDLVCKGKVRLVMITFISLLSF